MQCKWIFTVGLYYSFILLLINDNCKADKQQNDRTEKTGASLNIKNTEMVPHAEESVKQEASLMNLYMKMQVLLSFVNNVYQQERRKYNTIC